MGQKKENIMAYSQRSKLILAVSQWKAKAIARRKQVDALNKRILELTHSRDAWKTTAQTRQTRIEHLQTELRQCSRHPQETEKKDPSPAL